MAGAVGSALLAGQGFLQAFGRFLFLALGFSGVVVSHVPIIEQESPEKTRGAPVYTFKAKNSAGWTTR